jgi:hypothetical protein
LLLNLELKKYTTTQEVTTRTVEFPSIEATDVLTEVLRIGAQALLTRAIETKSDDGLVTWSSFDDELAEGKDFPIVRQMTRTELISHRADGQIQRMGGSGRGERHRQSVLTNVLSDTEKYAQMPPGENDCKLGAMGKSAFRD